MIAIGTRLVSFFVLLLLGVGVAAAQPVPQPAAPSPQVTIAGVTFPDRIAGAQRVGPPHDFESKTPGLGYSVEYQAPGWKIDVYIYDLGQSAIPDDPMSAPVTRQLVQATSDVQKSYTEVAIRLKYAILDDATRARFLCTAFGYTDRQGARDSYLCVTAANHKFVKFRLTTDHRPGSDTAANSFVLAWMRVLWPAA